MSDFVREYLLDEHLDDYTKLGDGTLVGAIAALNELAAKVPAERLGSVQFQFDDCGYGESSMYLKIWYERPKTAEELIAEKAEAERQLEGMRLQQERRERATLKALKEKYGE